MGALPPPGLDSLVELEPGVQEPDWAVVSSPLGLLALVVLELAVQESG